jgi:branched-chain amino acid transport system ATP-binding protein
MKALLEVDDLSKAFRGLSAVDHVGLKVGAGTVHGLIGPNGAGKTTFFNLVSGLLPPDQGRIRLDGQSLDGLPPWRRTAAGLARTFQNIRMFGEMSVLENVMTGRHLRIASGVLGALIRSRGFRDAEAAAKAASLDLLRLIGLAAAAGQRAGALSYGDQRRLEIARALAAFPKLLMLDEPAAGLNPAETHALADLIRGLRERGVTILLVEHDMPFVMGLCDRITVLNFGRKIAEGTPGEIRADAGVIEAYLGGALAEEFGAAS